MYASFMEEGIHLRIEAARWICWDYKILSFLLKLVAKHVKKIHIYYDILSQNQYPPVFFLPTPHASLMKDWMWYEVITVL